jgi:cytochrome P450
MNHCAFPANTSWSPVGDTTRRYSGGIRVAMSAFVTYRIESKFPRADQDISERWGEEGKWLQSFILAFSVGVRGCSGRDISSADKYSKKI